MRKISRRSAIQRIVGGMLTATAALSPGRLTPTALQAQEPECKTDFSSPADLAADFMRTCNVPGLSICIGRCGDIVYSEAFGFADCVTNDKVQISSRFRIASVSKTITSAAIFTLVQLATINRDEKVFGPTGILKQYHRGSPPLLYVNDITVDHLLTHTCGGWDNETFDPALSNDEMDFRDVISWTLLNHPLTCRPGTHYAYSNFGYCLLGRNYRRRRARHTRPTLVVLFSSPPEFTICR